MFLKLEFENDWSPNFQKPAFSLTRVIAYTEACCYCTSGDTQMYNRGTIEEQDSVCQLAEFFGFGSSCLERPAWLPVDLCFVSVSH